MIDPDDRYQNIEELYLALINKQDYCFWPPIGFRSRTLWKMIVASIVYFLIIDLSITINTEYSQTWQLYLYRFATFISLIAAVDVIFDGSHLFRNLPYYYHENNIIRYLLRAIYGFIVCIAIMFVCFFITE